MAVPTAGNSDAVETGAVVNDFPGNFAFLKAPVAEMRVVHYSIDQVYFEKSVAEVASPREPDDQLWHEACLNFVMKVVRKYVRGDRGQELLNDINTNTLGIPLSPIEPHSVIEIVSCTF